MHSGFASRRCRLVVRRARAIRNGKLFEQQVALIAAPEVPPRDLSLIRGSNPYAGSEVANLSPALAEELALDSEATGVIVLRLKRRSPADRIGLEPGDILVRLNGQEINSVATLKKLLTRDYSAWRIESTVQVGRSS